MHADWTDFPASEAAVDDAALNGKSDAFLGECVGIHIDVCFHPQVHEFATVEFHPVHIPRCVSDPDLSKCAVLDYAKFDWVP